MTADPPAIETTDEPDPRAQAEIEAHQLLQTRAFAAVVKSHPDPLLLLITADPQGIIGLRSNMEKEQIIASMMYLLQRINEGGMTRVHPEPLH